MAEWRILQHQIAFGWSYQLVGTDGFFPYTVGLGFRQAVCGVYGTWYEESGVNSR